MKYHFDEIVQRRGTHSVKWDMVKDIETLPMWIADMDFLTFPAVAESLSKKAASGFFGYNTIPSEFYDAIISWWQKQHGLTVEKNLISPTTGVVAGISAAIRALTDPGDGVIVQTPTYNHFFSMIEGCGCKVISNALICREGEYSLDIEDLENKAKDDRAKILLLCNPQNPVGRVWTQVELEQMASVCKRLNITVISDEIHSDLVFPGNKHIPFGQIAAKYDLASVTSSSASKTFNLSGLQVAYILASDLNIKKKVDKYLWAQASANPGLLAIEALVVSYTQGNDWMNQLKEYLWDNYLFLRSFMETHLPWIKVTPLQATYLVWIDCKAAAVSSADLSDRVLKDGKLWVNPGDMYGSSGEGFLRINIACPRETLRDGLDRLKNSMHNII